MYIIIYININVNHKTAKLCFVCSWKYININPECGYAMNKKKAEIIHVLQSIE